MTKNKELFLINFFINMFTFGGGYVVIPMMEKYFVIQKNYLSKDELYELATISQTSPGAIAINLAVLIGYRINKKREQLLVGWQEFFLHLLSYRLFLIAILPLRRIPWSMVS